ncbi:MAG: group III truncated hemoglobin [Sphingobacteriales bacterium]|nr:group III truncated hemoglobin [Sphingobacteriales bacterium]
MKVDINTRADIEMLINAFYTKVKKDETIGFIFNDVIKINWEHHTPLIIDFWETILLDNPIYKNNAMEVHYDINKKTPLQQHQFDQWLLLFNETVDELFEGKISMLAKTRAKSIASIMLLKMNSANDNR